MGRREMQRPFYFYEQIIVYVVNCERRLAF